MPKIDPTLEHTDADATPLPYDVEELTDCELELIGGGSGPSNPRRPL